MQRTLTSLAAMTLIMAAGSALLWWATPGQGSAMFVLVTVGIAVVAFEPSIMAAYRAHLAFYARLVATAVMVGGAFFLVPSMGADGVAAAVFANSVTQAVLLGLILMRLVRGRDDAALLKDAKGN